MISVFSTLGETFVLWRRNIILISFISLTFNIPAVLLNEWNQSLAKSMADLAAPAKESPESLEELEETNAKLTHELFFEQIPVSVLVMIVNLFVQVLCSAGILGLLKTQTSQEKRWDSIRVTIKTYTWTLFRAELILTLLGAVIGIVFGIVMATTATTISRNPNAFSFLSLIFSAIFLVFLKYALADPLIVLENYGAWDALARSWEMTKDRFVYVLGCYIFLWSGIWLIDRIMQYVDDRLTGTDLLSQVSYAFLDPLWIVMAWCMYLRIKAADQSPDEPVLAG